jgi:hypothetical protein
MRPTGKTSRPATMSLQAKPLSNWRGITLLACDATFVEYAHQEPTKGGLIDY